MCVLCISHFFYNYNGGIKKIQLQLNDPVLSEFFCLSRPPHHLRKLLGCYFRNVETDTKIYSEFFMDIPHPFSLLIYRFRTKNLKEIVFIFIVFSKVE